MRCPDTPRRSVPHGPCRTSPRRPSSARSVPRGKDGTPTGLRIALCAVAGLGACVPSDAAPPTSASEALASGIRAEITAEALLEHARAITAHERPSGSAGENAAIDYLVEVLRRDGVPVEVHEILAYTSDPVSASVEVPGTDVAPPAITMAYSGSVRGLEARLVDVGARSDLPALEVGTGERLELEGTAGSWGGDGGGGPVLPDVAGAIVLVEGQPGGSSLAVLERLGAAGVIFANAEERVTDLIVTTTWGQPSLLNHHRLNRLPVAHVTRSGADALRDLLARGPVRVRITTEVRTGWKPLRLAVARIDAPDPDAPLVLFGGHIDAWYHGGTDEGASNAAMVELARAFHRHRAGLRRSLVVAWWPGHSNGRYAGSTWFADHFFDELRRRGAAYVNIDGIGQMGAKRFSAAASTALEGVALEVIGDRTGENAASSLPGRNSDQSFNGAGLPLLQLNHARLEEDGGYWWWHTPDDTFDKIDPAVLKVDTDLYVDALARLLADPVLPVDLAAEVEGLGDLIRARRDETAGRLDLDEALARQAVLLERVRTIHQLTAGGGEDTAGAGLDLALLGILRPIHRATYVPLTEHHPDPGVGWTPLPGLAPAGILAEEEPGTDRYGFVQASLVRERNRLLEALDDAIREAELLLARLEDR